MSPETARLGNSSRPQVAAEGLIETRKEAFLKELELQKVFQDLQERGRKIRFYSPSGEYIP
jgi:hypothetical protein